MAGRGRQSRLRAPVARARPASAPSSMLQTGDKHGAAALLDAMSRMALGVGLMPEQNWENPPLAAVAVRAGPGHGLDRLRARRGRGLGDAADVGAGPARAARPCSLDEGRPLEQPAAVRDRYKAAAGEGRPDGDRPRRRLDGDGRDHARDRHRGAARAGRRRRDEHRHRARRPRSWRDHRRSARARST